MAALSGRVIGVEQGSLGFGRGKDSAAEVANLGGEPVEVHPFDEFARLSDVSRGLWAPHRQLSRAAQAVLAALIEELSTAS